MARKRIGERLVQAGLVSDFQLAEALDTQRVKGGLLGEVLVELGHLREDNLMRILSDEATIPFLEGDRLEPFPEAARVLPEPLARRLSAVPVASEDGRLTIALPNPFDLEAVMALERATGRLVTVVAAPRAELERLLARVYKAGPADPRRSDRSPAYEQESWGGVGTREPECPGRWTSVSTRS